MDRICIFFALFLLACGIYACDQDPVSEETKAPALTPDRPEHWALPISDQSGLTNFYKVSDTLYRGAQPEEIGFSSLKKMGFKTVVNLRSLHSDRDACKKAGLDYVKISAQAWEAEEDEVVKFLKVAVDPTRQPVFVHCQHGADRTGTMCAVYRMLVQGWPREEAIKEMVEGGFGFHAFWHNLVYYLEKVNLEALGEKSGIEMKQPPSHFKHGATR